MNREEFEQFAMAKIKEIAEEYKKFCKDKELYLSMSFIKDEEKGGTFNINNDYWKASVRVSAWEQVKE